MFFHPLVIRFFSSHRVLLSFPTRRSSDLKQCEAINDGAAERCHSCGMQFPAQSAAPAQSADWAGNCIDRKSTRLNSSHEWISYAVFCLKKKKVGKRSL